MQIKVGCISLGCPKNLVDSEIMLGMLNKDEYLITTDLSTADAIIVNTCAFINDAKEEAIDAILNASLYKKTGNLKALIVTGCMAQRYKDEIIKEIPEVDAVVGTGNIQEIRQVISEHVKGEGRRKLFVNDPKDVDYLDNIRMLSQSGRSQYLKIAEGCSNHCTYCIIPYLRGPFRSRTVESIVSEAERLVEAGARELILIAQDVTRYGEDRYGECRLVELIGRLSEIADLKWIRLLYCYPERVTEELVNEFKSNPKLLKYLDIPIQHASDKILRAMGRRTGKKELAELIVKLRTEIPDIVLRTTLITGFPGETEEDFNILKDFIKKYSFDRLGVFAYSREEGTPAAKMKNHVKESVKRKRREEIILLQQELVKPLIEKRVGRVYEVLAEGVADDGIFYFGRSYGEAPEIDPVIYFTSEKPVDIGSFVNVRILATNGMDLVGEVVYD
ncbi:ribosomal protein S12 methylthiotransferase RimO [Thermoclostridium stercorarium subsp. stercorarium DSM 8532]|uniref:Ribosomal protein uS12 methylthiotransferase RimO n=1 Tax=Thermoclostridium stercorarium (strain ATCC 35414 / DSM 8532 / NCIMB 11754) TaxID=1121335 RepID=L7VJB4_THES1|nr:30S ribosomal protein S12 methylthiotransferase RimO [Thermoclostridium stercorarium]AGC68145.1 ribosomal protein S12 methylthiotransferase RimO [Thermoclostridium stercorarium subsp. stercorarium DSM 8532]AGI39171.1 ribosomal protein S12P [Thermoclostridium stercorarium subsp. stercorarium DSM 8532]